MTILSLRHKSLILSAGTTRAIFSAALSSLCLVIPAVAQIDDRLEMEYFRLENLKREYHEALRRDHSAARRADARLKSEAREEERIFEQSMSRQRRNEAYRVHIGEFDSRLCPDGSQLQAEVIKHDVSKPSWNVREEHIVTRHKLTTSSGKPRYVMGDTFIRCTIQQRNRMHVQIVKRNFDDQGRLENQVNMSGMVAREKQQ